MQWFGSKKKKNGTNIFDIFLRCSNVVFVDVTMTDRMINYVYGQDIIESFNFSGIGLRN